MLQVQFPSQKQKTYTPPALIDQIKLKKIQSTKKGSQILKVKAKCIILESE